MAKVLMQSTSKSNERKAEKYKFVEKPKQQWQEKQQIRNWLEVPYDVMADILYRIGVFDILENAQKVCTVWRKICKEPSMWRVINMNNFLHDPNAKHQLCNMCKEAVDRSQGQLVDLTIVGFGDDELLLYVANRSNQLKRLEIAYGDIYQSWTEALKKFRLLEELSLYSTDISQEAIKIAGCYCPMLKTLKVNKKTCKMEGYSITYRSELAIAIGEYLHHLRHLELIGNFMSNLGLYVILDGCRHLELLDLRLCYFVNLEKSVGKRCMQQIKLVKLPDDSLKDSPYIYEYDTDRDV